MTAKEARQLSDNALAQEQIEADEETIKTLEEEIEKMAKNGCYSCSVRNTKYEYLDPQHVVFHFTQLGFNVKTSGSRFNVSWRRIQDKEIREDEEDTGNGTGTNHGFDF